MRGYPKFLNSREDYEYVKDNFPKELWEKDFKALLDSQYEWYFTSLLNNEQEGIVDDTHKVVESEQDGVKSYSQYEYRYNSNCKLAQLGYAREYVESLVLSD